MSTKPRPAGAVQSAALCRYAVVVDDSRVRCARGHLLGQSGLKDGVGLRYVLYMGGPRRCQLCKDFKNMS